MKTIPKLIPLSPESWEKFSGKAKWDCQSALRGPDLILNEDWLKWTTTSVIRANLKNVMRIGGLVNSDLNILVVPMGSRGRRADRATMEFSLKHFSGHVVEAGRWLGIPIVPVDFAVWENAWLRSTSLPTYLDNLAETIEVPSFKEELIRHRIDTYGGGL